MRLAAWAMLLSIAMHMATMLSPHHAPVMASMAGSMAAPALEAAAEGACAHAALAPIPGPKSASGACLMQGVCTRGRAALPAPTAAALVVLWPRAPAPTVAYAISNAAEARPRRLHVLFQTFRS